MNALSRFLKRLSLPVAVFGSLIPGSVGHAEPVINKPVGPGDKFSVTIADAASEGALQARFTPSGPDFAPDTSSVTNHAQNDAVAWARTNDEAKEQLFAIAGVEPESNIAALFEGNFVKGAGVDGKAPPVDLTWKTILSDISIEQIDVLFVDIPVDLEVVVLPDPLPEGVTATMVITPANAPATLLNAAGNPATSLPLQAGTQSISLKGTGASGEAEDVVLEAKIGNTTVATKKLTVVGIASVEWKGYDPGDNSTNYEKDGNPSTQGGGDRIFAERNQPQGRNGDQLHDRIQVMVTFDPAPPEDATFKLYFNIFDPDHWSDADVLNSAFDPNGATAPADNIAAGGAISSPGASLMEADFSAETSYLEISGDGETTTALIGMSIANRQPTNNFIVMAYPKEEVASAVEFADDGTTLQFEDDSPVPANLQTPLLTLWRTLYVERDRMGNPNYTTAGVSPSVRALGTVSDIIGQVFKSNYTIPQIGRDQFIKGKVELFDAANNTLGVLEVQENEDGQNSRIGLTQNVPASAVTFKNLSDDDVEHALEGADLAIDFTAWSSRYEPACIRVDTDKSDLSPVNGNTVNQENVGFRLNMGETTTSPAYYTAVRGFISNNKNSVSSNDFWVIYALGAFQGPARVVSGNSFVGDLDPEGEVAIFGQSTATVHATSNANSGIIVFREVIRDAVQKQPTAFKISEDNFVKMTSLHESGHEWGLNHQHHGLLMNEDAIFGADTAAKVDALQFNGAALLVIIARDHPGK